MSESHARALMFTAASVIVGVLGLGRAEAVTYGVDQITSNGNASIAGQLSIDVTDATIPGVPKVLFTIVNGLGGLASSIDAVYFDDGTLLALASILDSPPSTDFSTVPPPPPPNFPAGNSLNPKFVISAGFYATADSPSPTNGINPGESLGLLFTLQSGLVFADVLNAIGLGGADGGLRIGLHVQSIGGAGSESFLNTVPLPPALVLLGGGLAGLGVLAGRRKVKVRQQLLA